MADSLRNEQFLCNFGGLEANDMTKILNCESDIDDNAATLINVSNYHEFDDIINKPIFSKNTHFKVLGFNAESISSKIDSIKLFQETLKQKNIILDESFKPRQFPHLVFHFTSGTPNPVRAA